jgi:hypothetical protein
MPLMFENLEVNDLKKAFEKLIDWTGHKYSKSEKNDLWRVFYNKLKEHSSVVERM